MVGGILSVLVVAILGRVIGIPWNVVYIQIYSKISIDGFRTLSLSINPAVFVCPYRAILALCALSATHPAGKLILTLRQQYATAFLADAHRQHAALLTAVRAETGAHWWLDV